FDFPFAVPGNGELLFDVNHAPTFPADFGPRPALATLGPAAFRPWANPGFDLPCADGGQRTMRAHQHGRPTLVVFYLGFGCLRCVQQLEALSPKAKAFHDAGIEIVAIGDQTLAKTQEHVAALGDKKFAFPLLADPELAAFKAWRCFDDFEQMPLHGTFLVDADGRVRWQDISFEPFTQVDWLLAESQRLLALPAGAGSK
ncbi:MAG TPA: redoxin domain-containing protein, partial [Planctomycetota bacterium]|nr:redoxin domain-containing protein [Planctomycetota bacterium]